MATTTNNNKEEKINRDECHQCMMYLKSALLVASSKPRIIFQAMGVDTTPSSSSSSRIITKEAPNSNASSSDYIAPSFWEMEENGMEIRIRIPKDLSPSNRTIINGNRLSAFGGSKLTLQKKAPRLSELLDHNEASLKPGSNEWLQLKHDLEHKQSSTSTIVQQTIATAIDVKQHVATSPNDQVTQSSNQNQSNNLQHNYEQQVIPLSIICKVCGTEGPEGSARAYVRGPSPLSIVLCSNRLPTQDDISEVLTHELIHVYDVHSRKWDLTDCDTLAKSEIRAAREAECADATLNFTKRFCVRNKSGVATKNMFPGKKGRDCVGRVFEEAMQDFVPFDGDDKKRDNLDNNTKRGSHSHGNSGDTNSINGRVFQTSYSNKFHATTGSPSTQYFGTRGNNG